MRWALAFVAFCLAALPARAETLVLGLSQNDFGITSSFVGSTITVFGTIQRDAHTVARAGKYEIAIVVRGPRSNIVTRKKARVAGIWINNRSELFPGAPAYYAMLSSVPLGDMAGTHVLTENSIGTSYLVLQPRDSDEEFSDKAFRDALIRLKKEQNLYYDIPGGVEFLADSLFSATIPLPENVVVGDYVGDAYLFRDGSLLTSEKFAFRIRKLGFEQVMYDLAHVYPAYYGIAAVLLALVTGWAAGVIFRKD
ncbi:MAG: TIGR02186 family protein [Rhodobiaceae bacterium]|nr:TIGR02186 family protein [Rhodobiaceae bacterium]